MDDNQVATESQNSESALEITRALTRAGESFMLAYPQIANILEVSEARAKGLFAEEYLLDPSLDEWTRAIYFVRLSTALENLVGKSQSDYLWIISHNIALGDTPLNLIQTREGLIKVVHYAENSGNQE